MTIYLITICSIYIYIILFSFSLFNRVVISLRHKHGIAFAYSPRFDENVVVRNTYQDGQWGAEERSELLPYKRGALMQVGVSYM